MASFLICGGKEYIHSATVATIGCNGYPQTRIIDMMLWNENGKEVDE